MDPEFLVNAGFMCDKASATAAVLRNMIFRMLYSTGTLLRFCKTEYVPIQGVSKPMSQTFPGYSPPQNKSSYQHGSKNEQVLRYRLTFMCWYPFEYHIRCSKC